MATKVKSYGSGRQSWIGSRVNTKLNRARMADLANSTDNGVSIVSIEELNRKNARKCINCCTILSDNNKNDMAKVVFSVNLVKGPVGMDQTAKSSSKTAGGQGQVNGPNEKRILMSALQAMDVIFQVNDDPKLKQTIGAGSLCHNCTKTFGSFFQSYLQFISYGQGSSPIRTLVQSIPSIRRNLRSMLDVTGKPTGLPNIPMMGSTSSSSVNITKPKAPPPTALGKVATKPRPYLGPNANALAAAAVKKLTARPNISISVSRPELQKVIKQEPSAAQPPISTQSKSKEQAMPTPTFKLKAVPAPLPNVVPKPNPATTTATARLISKAAKAVSVPIQAPVPMPKPKLKSVSEPCLLQPPVSTKKEPDVDPLLEAEDDDLQSLLLSRGRKQQFTRVRDFDEPIFEVEAELLSEEEALSAASAVAVIQDPSRPPILSRAKDGDGCADGEEAEDLIEILYPVDDDEDYQPSSAKKRKRIRVRKSAQKTESKAKNPKRPENPAPEVIEKDKNNQAQDLEQPAPTATPTKPPVPDPLPVEIKCEECCELFEESDKLAIHVETHGEGKTWKCLLCNCGFKDFEHKSKHMLRAHLTTSVRTRSGASGRQGKDFQYGCGMCGLKFGVEAEFKEHQISAHFSCPTCVDDTFTSQEEINEHMDSHGAGWVGQAPSRSTRTRTSVVAAAVTGSPVKMEVEPGDLCAPEEQEQVQGPGSEPSTTALAPGRSRLKEPCPDCGKIVTRVDRHVAEVHKGQKRTPYSSKFKTKMRLKAKRAAAAGQTQVQTPASTTPNL